MQTEPKADRNRRLLFLLGCMRGQSGGSQHGHSRSHISIPVALIEGALNNFNEPFHFRDYLFSSDFVEIVQVSSKVIICDFF
jgi:hypothetical protein